MTINSTVFLIYNLKIPIKQPGHEADHSLSSSTKVKNVWSYAFTPQYVFKADA